MFVFLGRVRFILGSILGLGAFDVVVFLRVRYVVSVSWMFVGWIKIYTRGWIDI